MVIEMIKNIFLVFGIYLVTYLYGMPFACLLNNERLKKNRAILCPMYGLSIGMILMFYLNYIGFSILQIAWLLTLIFLVIDIVIIFTKKYEFEISWQKAIITMGIMIIIAFFLVLPGVIHNDGKLTILVSNNDFVLYASISNAVKHHGSAYIIENFGVVSEWIVGTQNRYACYWMALISTIFKIDIFNAQTLFSMFSYSMVVLGIVPLAQAFCEKKRNALIVGVVLLFNSNLLYLHFTGFIAQLISIAYMIVISLLVLWLAESKSVLKKEAIAMGILISGLSATYGEMLPIIVLPMVILLVVLSLKRKKVLNVFFVDCCIAMGTVAILFARGYYTAIKMLLLSNGVAVGWDVRAGYLLQALGIYDVQIVSVLGDYVWPEILVICISIVLLMLVLLWIWHKYNGERRSVLVVFLLTYVGIYLLFLHCYDLYKAYKALVNMSYFAVVAVVLFLLDNAKRKRCLKVMGYIVALIASVFLIRSTLFIYFWGYSNSEAIQDGYRLCGYTINTEHDELQQYLDMGEYSEIYVAGAAYWDNIAATTMGEKYDKPIYDVSEYILRAADNIIPNARAIVIDSSVWPEPIMYGGRTVLKNEVYTVKVIDTSYPICVNREELGNIETRGCTALGRTVSVRPLIEENTEIKFYINSDSFRDVHITLMADEENEIDIMMPDGKCERVLLSGGVNELFYQNVEFTEGMNNTIKIVRDHSDKSSICLQELYFDNNNVELINYNHPDVNKYNLLSIKEIVNRIEAQKNKYLVQLIGYEGTNISFDALGNCNKYISEGLWQEEATGRWTKGQFGISFKLKDVDNLIIKWGDSFSLLNTYGIKVICNDEEFGYLRVNPNHYLEDLIIPAEYLKKGRNHIEFVIEGVTSPEALQQGGDSRALGVYLSEIYVALDKEAKPKDIYRVGDVISFATSDYNAESYIVSGIGGSEIGGAWTIGTQSDLRLCLDDVASLSEKLRCSIKVVGVYNVCQNAKIKVNGTQVFEGEIIEPTVIEFEFLKPKDGKVAIQLLLPDAISPKDLEGAPDARQIALHIEEIVIEQIETE